MNKKLIFSSIAALLIVVVAILFSNNAEKRVVREDVKSDSLIPRNQILVIGTVGEIPAEEIEEYKPFIDFVASKLTELGIKRGEVVVAKSPAEMSKFMRQNKVDMYIDSPFPVYVVSKLAEAEVLVDRWKKGEEKYHSIIFTKKDSGIEKLDDLKGKVIAFESSYSTSGYFLPKSELIKRGYKLTQVIGPKEKVSNDEIGYYFTNDQEKVATDVLQGIAVMGAQNQKDVEEASLEHFSDLRIVFKTIDLYRHIIVTRKELPTDVRDAVKKIMIEMHTTPEGQKILADFKKTTRLNSQTSAEVFKGLSELTSLVENEIIRQ